jgi:hypothetical protein
MTFKGKNDSDVDPQQRELAEAHAVPTNREAPEPLEHDKKRLLSELETLLHRLNEEAGKREADWQKEVERRRGQLTEALRRDEEARRKELDQILQSDRERAARMREDEERAWRELMRLRQEEASGRETALNRRTEELDKQQADLKSRAENLDGREEETSRRETNQRIAEAELKLKQEATERQTAERVAETTAAWRDRCDAKDRTIEDLGAEVTSLGSRLEELKTLRLSLGGDPGTIKQVLKEQKDEIKRLEDELTDRPTRELQQRYDAVLREKNELQAQCDRLNEERIRLQGETLRSRYEANEMANLRMTVQTAERRAATFEKLNEALRAQVEHLRRIYERPKEQEAEARSRGIRQGCLPRADLAEAAGEEQWLEEIRAACERSGLYFPQRLLFQFHTALKTGDLSPLTVLAGVSGTGKSELPKRYARYGGLNFLPLAVQPNWDSPQSILGFFNSIEGQFNPTELLQALDQSQRDSGDGLGDQLLLVLLDEMNLAHVEQYFSDFISNLGSQRGLEDPVLLIDLGGGLRHELRLGSNILWAGAMNEDETTKALSDKVLDRGNVLYFPRPKTLCRRAKEDKEPERTGRLPRATWERWLRRESVFDARQVQPYKELLEKMNEYLERVGRALGHRVWQAVEGYMTNYPGVTGPGGEAAARVAFEDQVVLKVMPKLRGIETTGQARTECLDPIRALLVEFGLRLGEDFDLALSAGFGGFQWRSAHYLEADA